MHVQSQQSAARPDTNDLLQGQRSLFSEGKLLTVCGRRGGGGGGQRGERGILCWFSSDRGGKTKQAGPAAAPGLGRLLTGQLGGPQVSHQVHFPAPPSPIPPPPP